jgi:hypothetical protein
MSTYIELGSPAVDRIVAEALAHSSVTQAELVAMLSNDRVNAAFREGYALLLVRHADLFADIQESAAQALEQAIAWIFNLDPASNAEEIQETVALHKNAYAPAVRIYNEAAVRGPHANQESLEAAKARITQALLTGQFPAPLQAELA